MSKNNSLFDKVTSRKIFPKTILSFFISLIICSFVIAAIMSNKINLEKSLMEQVALEKSIKINEVLSKLLYKTQTLSTLAIQSNEEIEDFDQVAATIVDDSVILNVLAAPSGIVSNVYPVQGNEAVIGHDFFEDGAGNKEAMLAKETGELVLGGPFDLVQGGQALVGRLPVWIDTPEGGKSFWGLISITLKFPQILENIGLDTLEKQGLTYKIWRINPDNNEKQLICNGNKSYNESIRFIEKRIQISNAEWYLCIYPVFEWYQRLESWLMILVGICLSVLLASVIQNNIELKLMKTKLEEMARIDSLTGLNNRRYFEELAMMRFEQSKRLGRNCFVVIFDVDHFKQVNDKHGHGAGDIVLKSIAKSTKSIIRSYDILGRYGGEEFVILISDIEKADVINLVERIREVVEKTPTKYKDIYIPVSISFGIALATSADNLNMAIEFADIALYEAKEKGRNRVVYYDDTLKNKGNL